MNADCQETLVRRLVEKIRNNVDQISRIEEEETEGAEVVVVSYGITSRVAQRAIHMARTHGIKVGHLRLITVWPFPERKVRQLAEHVKAFVLPELNYGQVFLELQRSVEGKARTYLVPHGGGTVHRPEVVYEQIKEAVQ